MTTLKIEIQDAPSLPEAVILRFDGDMGSDTIDFIKQTFYTLEAGERYFSIADMSSVSMLSSAAIGELMGGRKKLIQLGGDLVLSGIIFDIRRKLSLMDATKIFRIFSDVRSALNAYKWERKQHTECIDLSIPSNLKIVPPVRQLVSRIAKQKGYRDRDAFRIEAIVDEICNNAIEHGAQNAKSNIDLKIKIAPDKVEIDVTNVSDPNKIFSLKAQPESDDSSQTSHKRGRGLMLIKMLTNELTLNTSEHGTVVHVKKLREE